MKILKSQFATLAPLLLCSFALNSRADLPATAVSPRNSIMTTAGTNGAGVITEVITNGITSVGTFTNVILTAPYQHRISCTTILTTTNAGVPGGTNTFGSSSFTFTNFFDLAKVVVTNGVSTTNWTANQPIKVTGSAAGAATQVYTATIDPTNYDSYELIKLSLIGHSATNNYGYTVILGQTP